MFFAQSLCNCPLLRNPHPSAPSHSQSLLRLPSPVFPATPNTSSWLRFSFLQFCYRDRLSQRVAAAILRSQTECEEAAAIG
ncbi:unnamed protein product [Linum trigynum]|uniref:Uncharacterized protein n=1 Tax=Linum trigynum TaxID=586398 RepID=A0AAV2GK06_9ROSI